MSMLLPLIEPEQERRNDVWAYVSPSRLNCWLSCPLKFKLKYLDRIPQPSSPNLFLGKQVHSGLEHYYRHRQLGITLPEDVLSARMRNDWGQAVQTEQMSFASVADESALCDQAIKLVGTYLHQVSLNEPAPLAVEATMEMPLVDPWNGEDLGIPLLGVVDLILDNFDGPTIADFKTSSKASPPHPITHEIQLSCYSYLFRESSGRREAGLEIRSLIKTKKPRFETHQYAARSDRHLQRLFAVIREYLDCLDSGTFNFRPSWGCGMCDFRDSHCRNWSG